MSRSIAIVRTRTRTSRAGAEGFRAKGRDEGPRKAAGGVQGCPPRAGRRTDFGSNGEMEGVDRFGRGRISAHQAVGYRIVPELDDLGAVPERFGNLTAGGHGGDGPPVPRPPLRLMRQGPSFGLDEATFENSRSEQETCQ